MSITRISGGHINETFLVKEDGLFVLQKINSRLFGQYAGHLDHNYRAYQKACMESECNTGKWECPEYIPDDKGSFFHIDENGDVWKKYRYIEGDDGGCSAYEYGVGLGKLSVIMKKCEDIRDIDTILHLHDLDHIYSEYLKQNDTNVQRDAELDEVISLRIDEQLNIRVPGGSVIHGDAKISNMIVQDGRVIGFIDLDTIMCGSIFDDIADCTKSFDDTMLSGFIRGYEDGSGMIFSEDEKELVVKNNEKNRFMLGIRYYTDYLSQAGYFFEDHPGRNIERARQMLLAFR